MRLALVLSTVLVFGAATAQRAEAHPPPFWWMADTSDTSHVGVEMMLGNPEVVPVALAIGTTTLAGGLYGHFSASPNVSVDARLPLAFSYFDDPILGEDSEGAIGNLSIGVNGFARQRRGFRNVIIYGGGFTIYAPTASDDGIAALTSFAAFQMSLPDPGRWFTNTTTARVRGDLRFESGAFFLQGETSLDLVFVDGGDDDILFNLDIGPGFKLNERLAMVMELGILAINEDENVTLDFGMRYHTFGILTGFRIYLPLSDPFRDNDLIAAGFDIAGRF